jgi:oligopeptide transport system ATP-binding protein
MHSETVLSVKGLTVSFSLRGETLRALRGVSLDVRKGESLAIVGESGSGKSVFCKSLMGLIDANGSIDSGSIEYEGRDLAKGLSEKEWESVRGGSIAMVMQDPMTSLNPLMRVGDQVAESAFLHQGMSRKQARKAAVGALRDVGLSEPERRARQYPHEFSGGMRQRVVIAIAIACRPKILICDEPTTALDVTIQAQILELVKEMQRRHSLTCVYVTHDLGVVASVADRVAVMYAGDVVEMGTCREVFHNPQHPYTWALLSSMPQLGTRGKDLFTIAGSPPDMSKPFEGDAFAPRNPFALKIDYKETPPYFSVSPTHKAKTWLLDARAPKVEPPDSVKRLGRGMA